MTAIIVALISAQTAYTAATNHDWETLTLSITIICAVLHDTHTGATRHDR